MELTVANFLSRIEQFIAAKGMTESAFGKAALGDPNFILELRRGRSPHLRTIERVQEYMRREVEGAAA